MSTGIADLRQRIQASGAPVCLAYEQVKGLLGQATLVDVRPPAEIEACGGMIPTAKNLPSTRAPRGPSD